MANNEEGNQERSKPSSASRRGRKPILLALGLALLAGVGLFGYRQMTQSEPNEPASESQVVATVNDAQITRNELDEQINQLITAGQVPPLEEIGEEQAALEQSVLEQMIANLLLIEDAQRQGITASEDEVDTQYNLIADQLDGQGSNFEELLATEGMTTEDLRQSLHDQLVLEAYFDRLIQEHDVSVSEEEIRQVFEAQVGQEDTNITFETAEPQIRQQLEQQKLAEVLPVVVAELTEQATVEILI